MRPFYFHIGIPKTGTSALQLYLAMNETKLDALGYNYLPIGNRRGRDPNRIQQGNGQLLARSFPSSKDLFNTRRNHDGFVRELVGAMKATGDRAPILSGEMFCELSDKDLDFMIKLIQREGFTVKILIWVREQGSYLESLYNQDIKMRFCTEDIDAYTDRMFTEAAYLRFGSYVGRLAGLVGDDNMIVKIHGTQDVYDTVDELFGLPSGKLERPDAGINVSLSLGKSEILRELNKLDRPQSFSKALIKNESMLSQIDGAKSLTLLSPERQAKLDALYASENQLLADTWFGGTPVFQKKEKTYIAQDKLLETLDPREIIQFMGGVLVRNEERMTTLEKQVEALTKAVTGNRKG